MLSNSHAEICELLKIDDSSPAPRWTPYAVKKTIVEILVNGERVQIYGGGMRCGICDYGIDIHPEGDSCPNCGTKTNERNIGNTIMIKRNDTVRILSEDINGINGYGRVEKVYLNGTYWIKNLNMPFQGTINHNYTADEIRKVI